MPHKPQNVEMVLIALQECVEDRHAPSRDLLCELTGLSIGTVHSVLHMLASEGVVYHAMPSLAGGCLGNGKRAARWLFTTDFMNPLFGQDDFHDPLCEGWEYCREQCATELSEYVRCGSHIIGGRYMDTAK